MRKLEKFLIAFAVISIGMYLAEISGAAFLTMVSLLMVASFYGVFSFALLNGIGFRKIFLKSSYSPVSALRMLGAIATGMIVGTFGNFIQFRLLNLEGSSGLFISAIVPFVIIFGVALYKFIKTKDDFYPGILIRLGLFAAVSMVVLLKF